MVSSSNYSDHESELSEILQKKRRFSETVAAKNMRTLTFLLQNRIATSL
ncbi:MAG TPA: hypothetical protein VFR94_23500 [Nitrososphaeraceae archaeon]|nr:hypothetical protein [Nitrososphaeraceae archaeon]